jgi:hypothetical protein
VAKFCDLIIGVMIAFAGFCTSLFLFSSLSYQLLFYSLFLAAFIYLSIAHLRYYQKEIQEAFKAVNNLLIFDNKLTGGAPTNYGQYYYFNCIKCNTTTFSEQELISCTFCGATIEDEWPDEVSL